MWILRAWAARAQVLHDRLAALEMMLLQKPIVSGRYSGCIHKRFMLPLRPYYDFTLRRWAPFRRPRGARLALPTSPCLAHADHSRRSCQVLHHMDLASAYS